jgi:hypothetical protein
MLQIEKAMRLRGLVGIPFLLSLSSSALAAVMVLPVQGTNLEPGEAEAIGQMVAAAYQIESKDRVVAPPDVQKALDETGSYETAAKKLGASEYVYVSAVRLNQRIVITGARYSADGKLLFSEKISATTLDDAEPGSERLARALLSHKTATETRTLDNVTITEKAPPNRMGTQKVPGFKGSFTFPVGWSEEVAPMMSASFDLRLEHVSHFIEFGIGFTVPAADYDYAYGGVFLDIGGNLYLSHTSTAPYLGAGLMPRLMSSDSIANFLVYAQAGVMFFREASTRFYADFRVGQNLIPLTYGTEPVQEYDPDTGLPLPVEEPEKTRLFPTEFTLSVGLGF